MTFDAGLAREGLRYDIHPEMGLATGAVPGMAFVLVRFIQHPQALRNQGFGQLLFKTLCGLHTTQLGNRAASVNAVESVLPGRFQDVPLSRLAIIL